VAIGVMTFVVVKGFAAIREDDNGRGWKGVKGESKSSRRRSNWCPFGDISLEWRL